MQRQKENDPTELKARIRQLEKEAKAGGATKEPQLIADPKAITAAVKQRDKQWQEAILQFRHGLESGLKRAAATPMYLPPEFTAESGVPVRIVQGKDGTRGAIISLADRNKGNVVPIPNEVVYGTKLPPGERAILIAAAQYSDGVDRDQLSVLTGYKRSSRDAYIQRLREKGLVEITGNVLVATPDGVLALGSDYRRLPTGEALQEYWRARLPEGERKVLEILLSAGGKSVPREVIDESTEYKRSSRDAYLQRLAARRLVEYSGRGEVKASSTLF